MKTIRVEVIESTSFEHKQLKRNLTLIISIRDLSQWDSMIKKYNKYLQNSNLTLNFWEKVVSKSWKPLAIKSSHYLGSLSLLSNKSDLSLMILRDKTRILKKLARSKIHKLFYGKVIKGFSCPLMNSSKDK